MLTILQTSFEGFQTSKIVAGKGATLKIWGAWAVWLD